MPMTIEFRPGAQPERSKCRLSGVGCACRRTTRFGRRHISAVTSTRTCPIRFADGFELPPEVALDTVSYPITRLAVRTATGVAQLLRPTVANELAAGRPLRSYRNILSPSPGVSAFHAFGCLPPLHVRPFTGFLADELAQHKTYAPGTRLLMTSLSPLVPGEVGKRPS